MLKLMNVVWLIVCFPVLGAQQEKWLVDLAYRLDTQLFDKGFNECKTEVLNSIIDEDVEFYHDIGGLIKGKSAFIRSIEEGICALDYKATRELSNAIDIFPLKDNGLVYAIWVKGSHDFYAQYPNENKKNHTSRAKFDILWQKRQGEWRMTRAYSFNHISGGPQ